MLKKIAVLLVLLGCSFALMLLTTGESKFEVRSQASFPVSQAEVWQVLVAVGQWPDWWPGMEDARLEGAMTAGSEIGLRLKGMTSSELVMLTEVRSLDELVWEGAGVFGSRTGTGFSLNSETQGCRLTVTNFVHGPQAFLARITGKDAFVQYQQELLQSLRRSLQR